MTNVYKFEVLIIDHQNYGQESLTQQLENLRYCGPQVLSALSTEVEWSDEHPLNQKDTCRAEIAKLFPKG